MAFPFLFRRSRLDSVDSDDSLLRGSENGDRDSDDEEGSTRGTEDLHDELWKEYDEVMNYGPDFIIDAKDREM